MSKIYFGIDLGTSSSSISYLVDSVRAGKSIYVEPETIKFSPLSGASLFQNWQRLPSVVYVEKNNGKTKVISGFQAEQAADGRLARPFENFFVSVKSDMGTLKVYEDSIHLDILAPVDVSAEIIKELIRAAEKATGISPKKCNVVITVPASFTHNQREDTIKAARAAGLTIDDGDLIDEPVAAFIHTACHQMLDAQLDLTKPRNILIFDLGAGTCDISIFTASYDNNKGSEGIGLRIRNRAISNYEKLGGDNIDLHIVEKEMLGIFCDKNEIDFAGLPEKVKREIRFRLKLKARQLKEALCRQIIDNGFDEKIKQTWAIDPFMVTGFEAKTRKAAGTMTLERFIELMEPFVSGDGPKLYRMVDDYFTGSFLAPIFNALNKADMSPEDIDAFIFNGGSCHNPVIRQRLTAEGMFPNARFFDTPDLDLSVSKGAAIHCYYTHKHEYPVVTPIVNSEIGILTLGLKREPLVEAGRELPFPAEEGYYLKENFFVPKDNIVDVGISIYSGERSRIISNLKLMLPAGVRKGEPVTIGVRIDRNKVMSITAFMKNNPEIKVDAELSHPWTHNINTPEDMDADRLWQEVAAKKKKRLPVETDTLISLAEKERQRENIWGALEILQRLKGKNVDTHSLNNLLAICYDQLGDSAKALELFSKAVQQNQNNAVLIANHGAQLIECGKVQEGISRLRMALEIDPDSYYSYLWLGHAYRELRDEEQAVKEYTRARQCVRALAVQQPNSEKILSALETASRAIGDYEEADRAKKELMDLRHSKILGTSPDRLLAGSESGIWKEADL